MVFLCYFYIASQIGQNNGFITLQLKLEETDKYCLGKFYCFSDSANNKYIIMTHLIEDDRISALYDVNDTIKIGNTYSMRIIENICPKFIAFQTNNPGPAYLCNILYREDRNLLCKIYETPNIVNGKYYRKDKE